MLKGIKWAEELTMFLIFLFLLFPYSAVAELKADWIGGTVTVKQELLDNRRQKECDDIRPRWAPDKKIVVFESIGRGKRSYQELSYINLGIEEKPFVLPFIKEEFRYEEEDKDFSPSFEKGYMSYISWIATSTPTVIFNKGIYEIARYHIDNKEINPFLSLEKKVEKDTIFLRRRGTETLFYLKEDGGIMETATNIDDEDWEPVVTINGDCSKDRKVVFISTIAGNDGELYAFELPERGNLIDLSKIKQLTFDNSKMEMNPKFSPDGNGIVYSSYKGDNMDICLITDISDDKIKPIQLTTDTTTYECNPTFSPDGQMIAYYSTRDGERYDLWVINSNGENKKKIAENVFKTDIYGPCWVPYGTSTLIYIYGTQDKIEIQDVVSSETKTITTGDKVMSDIDCLYDSNTLKIVYSAVDDITRRKRIFIKEVQMILKGRN